jgi:uncharacterized protein YwqG
LLAPHECTAWLPKTVDEDHGAAASKFGGMALISADYPVPTCPGCQQPMTLLVQLNAADLPAEMAGRLHEQIFQLFYCTNGQTTCESDYEAYFPFSKSVVARLVPLVEPVAGFLAPNGFAAKTIVGWVAFLELPHTEDWPALQGAISWDETERIMESEWYMCADNDKLGGWPHWIQGPEYPNCPDCGQQMQLLFQLASEDHLPYMFGDMGIGHITQCPQHPQMLAFGWACT